MAGSSLFLGNLRKPQCSAAAQYNLSTHAKQVLDDNVYEQRAAAAAAAAAGGGQPASMEIEGPVEEPAGAAEESAGAAEPAAVSTDAPVLRRSSLSGRTSSGGSEEAGKEKKKVRFEGIAAPYVPPSRRPGYVPRWMGCIVVEWPLGGMGGRACLCWLAGNGLLLCSLVSWS